MDFPHLIVTIEQKRIHFPPERQTWQTWLRNLYLAFPSAYERRGEATAAKPASSRVEPSKTLGEALLSSSSLLWLSPLVSASDSAVTSEDSTVVFQ